MLIGGGVISKKPISATGDLCALPNPEQSAFRDKEGKIDQKLLDAFPESDLPTVSCKIKLKNKTYTLSFKATSLVVVPKRDLVRYASEITIDNKKSSYNFTSELSYEIRWLGDVNGDGQLDAITFEESDFNEQVGATTRLFISVGAGEEDELLLLESGKYQTEGC